MEHHYENTLIMNCNTEDFKPAKVDLPYPKIQVKGKNMNYAHILSVDYTGSVSEFTAINQYVNHETRFTLKHCNVTSTILSIAQTEMEHLQIIGELIILLGCPLSYTAHYGKKKRMWTPKYISYEKYGKNMIIEDIKSEKEAIRQYKCHIKLIDDTCITDIIERIILDEEYHIKLLEDCLEEFTS